MSIPNSRAIRNLSTLLGAVILELY